MDYTQTPQAGDANNEHDSGRPGFFRRAAIGFAGRAAIGAMTLMAVSAPVLAQTNRMLPPENETGIKGKTWISGAVLVLLLALVLTASFLKSKRGHQD